MPLDPAFGPLTEYAWKFRCPGEPDGPMSDEATHAIEVAREVVRAIIGTLPVELRA